MTHHRQRGVTLVRVSLIVLSVVLVGGFLVRFVPLYLENFTIKESLKSLTEEPSLAQQTEQQIRQLLLKRLMINEVRKFEDKDVIVTDKNGKKVVSLDYERRVQLVGNMDLVVSFNNSVEVER